jgi:threonine/homoserine/homoserine lactone efflux protein
VIDLVAAIALGLGLGIVTGMPLAVVNVAIFDAATAGRRRFAHGLALGGGIADLVHAGLAFAGVGRVVTANPALVRVLAVAAAVVIIGYAVLAWRRRRADPVASASAPDQLGRGVVTGAMLTLPNPGALAAWIAVAAAVWPGATPAEAGLIAGGVGTGSALWFTLLARWLSRIRPDHPAVRWIPRIALILLVGIAVVGVVRAMTAAPA